MYRDAANYKNWGCIVFANRGAHEPDWIEERARQVLIDGEFFIAQMAHIPDLHFSDHVAALDHDWHAMHRFIGTDEEPDDVEGRDVEDLLRDLDFAGARSV